MSIKQSDKYVVEPETRAKHRQSKKRAPQSGKGKRQSIKEISTSKQSRRQAKLKRKQERLLRKKPRRRIFPIWIRIIVVLLLAIAALTGGLMVGYGILGDGVPSDALKIETWQHIIDIVIKKE